MQPVVLAYAWTKYSSQPVPMCCSFETYEEAPNAICAVHKAGEEWNWIKVKYGKKSRDNEEKITGNQGANGHIIPS